MNSSRRQDGDANRVGTEFRELKDVPYPQREQSAAKFIQICASQNDLFTLDEDGKVYQYNFNAKTWVTLVASRSSERQA